MANERVAWNKGLSMKSLGMSRPRTKWLEQSCQVCESSFFDYPSRKRLTCSRPCAAKLRGSKNSGENHYRWKGGLSSPDRVQRLKFRNLMQKKVFERDNYTCKKCNKKGGYLQVDHIKKWSKYPELRFEMDNCRTLCMGCHYKITFNKEMPIGTIWGHNLSRRIIS